MIDKLGLDGLGGASVRVEPTPQEQKVTPPVDGQSKSAFTPSDGDTPAVVGLEPVHWYLENEDEYMSEKLRKEHERLNSYTFMLCKVAHPLYSAADVAKLQAENEALRVMTNPEMLDHYQALQGENESLRKDAERYRWLREKDWLTEGILKIYWSSEESENLVGVELDAAIDATMTQERDHWREANRTSLAAGDILKEQLTASKAYAAQLREALEICKKEMQGDKWDALYIDGVLAGK